MIKREPLDHDMIIDKDLNVHIVFGSTHPPGRVFTYVKYIPMRGRDSRANWSLMGIPLQRVIERYSIADVEKAFKEYQLSLWDPVYGAEMPSIGYLDIWRHLLPEERCFEVYTKPKDALEVIASELIEIVRSRTGISIRDIGISGSLLGSFHVIGRSDIDLVIYGCRNAETIYEKASEIGDPIRGKRLEKWVENLSKLHGIPLEIAKSMYSPYRRLSHMGVDVTFIFPESAHRYGEEIAINTGKCVEARVNIPEKQCSALQYPGKAHIEKVLNSEHGVENIEEVILFEGVYSPTLYRGGVLRVRGLLQVIRPRGRYRIAIGTRECRGYVLPG
jgi:predicted nucleotidyltransferase